MKQAFIDRLKAEGYSKAEAEDILRIMAEEVAKTLSEDYAVRLPWVGKLTLKHTVARTGRNPKTGEPVDIPSRLAVRWKPSKALMDRIRRTPA